MHLEPRPATVLSKNMPWIVHRATKAIKFAATHDILQVFKPPLDINKASAAFESQSLVQVNAIEAVKLLLHDLRAPQSSILALLKMTTPTEQDTELHSRIRRQVETTLALTDKLFWHVRCQSDIPEFQEIELRSLVEEVRDRAWVLAREKDIHLQIDTATFPDEMHHDDGIWLNAEPRLLSRAIFNLVENAIKYSPRQTCVKIGIELHHQASKHSQEAGNHAFVNISVSDQGYGIAAEDIPKVFDAYTRFTDSKGSMKKSASIPGMANGHGLGLVLVKTVVEMHHGLINCESILGKGSVFTISLLAPVDPKSTANFFD